jgi:peroxiredoxin
MSERKPESLQQIFRDLHAHRVKTMDPSKLKINVDQRKTLVDTADRSQFVQVGTQVAPFSLREVDGDTLTLDGLLRHGPLVLVFFRFEGCPACNLALPYYQRNLLPGLRAASASLVAVSPQDPERLRSIKKRHQLDFAVASDGNELGRRFGILYSFDAPSREAAIQAGRPIGEITGTGTWELPMPTVVVINRSRVVRFVDVNPDWLIRTEAAPILEVVTQLSTASRDGSAQAQAR